MIFCCIMGCQYALASIRVAYNHFLPEMSLRWWTSFWQTTRLIDSCSSSVTTGFPTINSHNVTKLLQLQTKKPGKLHIARIRQHFEEDVSRIGRPCPAPSPWLSGYLLLSLIKNIYQVICSRCLMIFPLWFPNQEKEDPVWPWELIGSHWSFL